MNEFEYLQKQYNRLGEASAAVHRAKDDGERTMAENWMLSVKNSLKDYLTLRATSPQSREGERT